MADREKVIQGLEVCLAADLTKDGNPCAPCPYFFDGMCQNTMKEDAIALLREQEDDTDWKAVAMTLAATLSEMKTDVCCDSRCGQGFYCVGHNNLGLTPTRCWIEWAKGEKLWMPEVSGDG